MKRLEYKFESLDGYYYIDINFDENVFVVDTSIETLESKQGTFDDEIINKLNSLKLKDWDRYYNAYGSEITDATKWSLKYYEDDNLYETEGEESYEPYKYNDLIDLFCILDKNAKYLKFE